MKSTYKVVGVVVVALTMFALVLGLAACGGNETTETSTEVTATEAEGTVTTAEVTQPAATIDEALVGTWRSDAEGETIQFTAEGKLTVNADDGTVMEMNYSVQEGGLVLSVDGNVSEPVVYSVEGDVLTMTDPETGEPVPYQRVVE